MTETPASDSAPTARAPKPPKAPKSPGQGSSTPGGRPAPSWAGLAALVIAVVAVVLAVIGWFRPTSGPGSFTDQQRQDAKAHVCTATGTVRQGTNINTNLMNPVPGDPIGALAVAANARLALYGGGGYLRDALREEPATPDDLSKVVTAMANTMQGLAVNYLAGAVPDGPVQMPLRDNLKAQIAELDQLCQQ